MPHLRQTPPDDLRLPEVINLRRRILAALAIAGAPELLKASVETRGKTAEETTIVRQSRRKVTRHGAGASAALGLAAGLGVATLLAPSTVDAKDVGSYLRGPDPGRVHGRFHETAPEVWDEAEIERMGSAYSIVRNHRINPSLQGALREQGDEEEFYKILDAAISNPTLIEYQDRDGMIHLVARYPDNTEVPAGFEIMIEEGLQKGRITQARWSASTQPIVIDKNAWATWDEFLTDIMERQGIELARFRRIVGAIEPGRGIKDRRLIAEFRLAMPGLIQKLWELDQKNGYLNPAAQDPAQNAGMATFLERVITQPTTIGPPLSLGILVNPANPGVVQIVMPIENFRPFRGGKPIAAFTTDGMPLERIQERPIPLYAIPNGATVQSVSDLIKARVRAQVRVR